MSTAKFLCVRRRDSSRVDFVGPNSSARKRTSLLAPHVPDANPPSTVRIDGYEWQETYSSPPVRLAQIGAINAGRPFHMQISGGTRSLATAGARRVCVSHEEHCFIRCAHHDPSRSVFSETSATWRGCPSGGISRSVVQVDARHIAMLAAVVLSSTS